MENGLPPPGPLQRNKRHTSRAFLLARVVKTCGVALALAFALFLPLGLAQEAAQPGPAHAPSSGAALPVNWLYGAYVPKNVALEPLNGSERFDLYLRQTFTTPGIYIKTGIFSIRDQITNVPAQWGDGFSGYGKRAVSRQAQFIIQNSISSLGDAALGYEPRYDRCRCDGFWPRTWHAVVRNFVTYNRTERERRPRIAAYVAAFGSGSITAAWQPGNPNLLVKGYQSAITQAGVGIGINWLGEFAPEIKHILRKTKDPDK